jgi:hypothetical protein
VAAIVDRGATLRRVVDGAEVLPFGSAHLGTCCGTARWVVGEEVYDDGVGLLDQEAGEFVEPDFFGSIGWWLAELEGEIGSDWVDGVGVCRMCMRVMERFEVFGELEGRVDLGGYSV